MRRFDPDACFAKFDFRQIVKSFWVEQPANLSEALSLMCARLDSGQTNSNLAASEAMVLGPGDSLPEARAWLAGGQSILAAMKLGMNEPELLIDLQSLKELRGIDLSGASSVLKIGAMETHAAIASSEPVHRFCVNIAALAEGIGDQQVRNMGTIGGSLANNDPAACWPTALLALAGNVQTNQRTIASDEFFKGIFATALQPGELILNICFPRPDAFKYIKFEQPASRFALLGVAIARFGSQVRVAITGLGHGVVRWLEAEQALSQRFALEALAELRFPMDRALPDLHASAEYRAHLVEVLCRRAVGAILSNSHSERPTNLEPQASPMGLLAGAWSRLRTIIRPKN
jgi:aerobic carbon-monoxide dehydrogenase medium subunit